MIPDSSWSRLQTAWRPHGRHVPALAECVEPPLRKPSEATEGALSEGPVLIASLETAVPSLKARYPAYAALASGSTHSLSMALLADGDELDRLLAHYRPRVLVIDVESCEQLGAATLRRLRRRHGRVDWILSWDQPSPKWLPVLLDSRAKGFLRPSSVVEFERALEAVLKGELWFPRSVSQWLYRSLLDASRTGEGDADAGRDAELTSREAEVMALMRRGLTNKQIGLRLGISVNTVKKHIGHAFEKRGLHSRRQALT